MIDTHCHLDLDAFDADRDAVIARATAAGVTGILVPAVRPRTWGALLALAARHTDAGLRVALGIHPQAVPALAPGEPGSGGDMDIDVDIDALAERIAAACAGADVVAVGECGLDGGTADMPAQERIFRAHVRAARAVRKPLVIHVLRAHDLAPRVLREERAGECGGVLHSYSGGVDLVPVYAAMDLYFSLAGPVTYANARRPVEAARVIAADRLLVETDAPDQAPVPHRGGRSEPAFVGAVLAGLAAARGADASELAALTTANAKRLFATWR